MKRKTNTAKGSGFAKKKPTSDKNTRALKPSGLRNRHISKTSENTTKKYHDPTTGKEKIVKGSEDYFTGNNRTQKSSNKPSQDYKKKSFAPDKYAKPRRTFGASDAAKPKKLTRETRKGKNKSTLEPDGYASKSGRHLTQKNGTFDSGSYKRKSFKPEDRSTEKEESKSNKTPVSHAARKPLTSFKEIYRKKGGAERNVKKYKKSDAKEETYLGKFFKTKKESDHVGTNKKRFSKNASAQSETSGEIRLNRFIANAGVCSRREADHLIMAGDISVNGEKITELGFKIKAGDIVKYGNRILNREPLRYVLINKPKDFITTTDDPEERKTVMELVKNACKERIYPVGRLDRNTTGLLLLTNDGELAQKLTHPSFNIKKIYAVELNKPITPEDAQQILDGILLEEGKAIVDSLAILDETRRSVGIELHIGWNHVVRRIFAALGYDVVKLDRVMYAGLTKKDLPRGHWRHLSEKEVITLKHLL